MEMVPTSTPGLLKCPNCGNRQQEAYGTAFGRAIKIPENR